MATTSSPFDVDDKYLHAISRAFSPIVLDNLVWHSRSDYLAEVCRTSELSDNLDPSMSLADFFEALYRLLFRRYRTEYCYRNAIANKVVLGRHSLTTAKMLSEVRVGRSKADVLVLNGTSTVYEIKSEFDSFARLERQVESYLSAFDHINIITTAHQAQAAIELLPGSIGVLVLTNRGQISTLRPSRSNVHRIDSAALFETLRKDEYLRVIRSFYEAAPNVPNTRLFRECKRLFCAMPTEEAHRLAVDALNARSQSEHFKDEIGRVPKSLKAFALRVADDRHALPSLHSVLARPAGAILQL